MARKGTKRAGISAQRNTSSRAHLVPSAPQNFPGALAKPLSRVFPEVQGDSRSQGYQHFSHTQTRHPTNMPSGSHSALVSLWNISV